RPGSNATGQIERLIAGLPTRGTASFGKNPERSFNGVLVLLAEPPDAASLARDAPRVHCASGSRGGTSAAAAEGDRMMGRARWGLLVLVLVLAGPQPSEAAERFVSNVGSATLPGGGANTCTSSATPCHTARALAVAVCGDTITFLDGTY